MSHSKQRRKSMTSFEQWEDSYFHIFLPWKRGILNSYLFQGKSRSSPIKDNQSICCFPFLQGVERRAARKLEPFPFYHGILSLYKHTLKEHSSPKERPGSHIMHFKHFSCPHLAWKQCICICLQTCKGTVLGWKRSEPCLDLISLFIKWRNIWHSQWTKKEKGHHSKEEEEGPTLKLQFKNLQLGLIYMWLVRIWIKSFCPREEVVFCYRLRCSSHVDWGWVQV